MTKEEALKLALEALATLHDENMDYLVRNKLGGENNQCLVFAREAITAIKEALMSGTDGAQPEQEPINDGWQITFANGHSGFGVYAHMDEHPEEGSILLCAVPQWAKDALKTTTPLPCQTCEALARTVMMDQTGRDA